MKWAVTERFSDYLKYGPPVVDNGEVECKWAALGSLVIRIQCFNQIPSREDNADADADADGLSRNLMSMEEMQQYCTNEVNPEDIGCSGIAIDELEWRAKASNEPVTISDVIANQQNDLVVSPVCDAVLLGKRPQKDG